MGHEDTEEITSREAFREMFKMCMIDIYKDHYPNGGKENE